MICRNYKCKRDLPEGALYCPYCGYKQEVIRRRGKRPNGSGTVCKLKGNRSRPWIAARGKIIIGYASTKAEALKLLDQTSGLDITSKYNMTFAQVYDEWSAEHFRDISEKGIESYKNAFNHFESLHGKQFRQIRTKDFQTVFDELEVAGKSASLMNKHKQLINQMSKWALREELIHINYAQFVKIPVQQKKEKPVFTKVKDDVPAIYGLDSQVSNSLVADGCVIEGHVENSVLFRGVHIARCE